MSTWSNRIKTRMKELDMTQEILANKMGITRGAVTHYLAGRRVPPLKQFQKLAVILKSDPAWLQFGTATEVSKKKAQNKNELATQKRIPIVTWEQITDHLDISNIKEDVIKEFVPNLYTDKQNWYALRVKSDAMTSPAGHIKNFHTGNVLIVDPHKEAENGNFVIVLLPRSNEATFKQYVIDGGVKYLKPLNPQYPIVEFDEAMHICGVVLMNLNFL